MRVSSGCLPEGVTWPADRPVGPKRHFCISAVLGGLKRHFRYKVPFWLKTCQFSYLWPYSFSGPVLLRELSTGKTVLCLSMIVRHEDQRGKEVEVRELPLEGQNDPKMDFWLKLKNRPILRTFCPTSALTIIKEDPDLFVHTTRALSYDYCRNQGIRP